MNCRYGKLSDELQRLCKELKVKIRVETTSNDPGYWLECPKGYHFILNGYHFENGVYPAGTPAMNEPEREAMDLLSAGVELCSKETPCDNMDSGDDCYWQ